MQYHPFGLFARSAYCDQPQRFDKAAHGVWAGSSHARGVLMSSREHLLARDALQRHPDPRRLVSINHLSNADDRGGVGGCEGAH